MAAAEQLLVLMNGRRVGEVTRQQGRLIFVYDDAWRGARGAYPLSLSMPLTAAEHGHRPVEAFIWGLLPDNERVLDRWAKRFQVSARNPFGLIAGVGEDCAGAVQFVRPERLEAMLDGTADGVAWLDERDIAERLRNLRDDHAAWRTPRDNGQFSLAGAQPKTAFLREGDRWGIPSGRLPTTHILKPPTGEYDGHAENEHYCLTLARRLGLPTARSSVTRFEDEIAIVVERYDRVRAGERLQRVHQEDMCQSLAHPPSSKYENEGGPGAKAIAGLLREHAGEADVDAFLNAMLFNWIVAGTDAHAKNYSVLIGANGRVRLAPFYDIASALPYPDLPFQKLKLAMRMGGEYGLRDIRARHIERLAAEVRRPPEELLVRARALAVRLPDLAGDVAAAVGEEGLNHPIVARLRDGIAARADEVAGFLG